MGMIVLFIAALVILASAYYLLIHRNKDRLTGRDRELDRDHESRPRSP